MGKRSIVRARGKGSFSYRAPSHQWAGRVEYPAVSDKNVEATIMDIMHDAGRNAPVAKVRFADGEEILIIAPENIKVGGKISCGISAPATPGNLLTLAEIPERTFICAIEARPGSGPKFCRSSGTYAIVAAHDIGKTMVQMPSGELKEFKPLCRATIGIPAGGGRKDKPFVKGGTKLHLMRARGKLFPRSKGVCMNPVDHPFGGKTKPGHPKTVSRDAPPGQKIGYIAARRTGRKKV